LLKLVEIGLCYDDNVTSNLLFPSGWYLLCHNYVVVKATLII